MYGTQNKQENCFCDIEAFCILAPYFSLDPAMKLYAEAGLISASGLAAAGTGHARVVENCSGRPLRMSDSRARFGL